MSQQTNIREIEVEIEDGYRPGGWRRRWDLPKSVGQLSSWRDRYRWCIVISVKDGTIGHGEAVLAHFLADKAGPRGVDIKGLSYVDLGKAVGRCPRQVATYLANLAEIGLVIWHHNMVRTPHGQVKQRPNTYRLLIPPELIEKMQRLRAETRKPKPRTVKATNQSLPATHQRRSTSSSSKKVTSSAVHEVVIVGAPPEPAQEMSIAESRKAARVNLKRSYNPRSDQDQVP